MSVLSVSLWTSCFPMTRWEIISSEWAFLENSSISVREIKYAFEFGPYTYPIRSITILFHTMMQNTSSYSVPSVILLVSKYIFFYFSNHHSRFMMRIIFIFQLVRRWIRTARNMFWTSGCALKRSNWLLLIVLCFFTLFQLRFYWNGFVVERKRDREKKMMSSDWMVYIVN